MKKTGGGLGNLRSPMDKCHHGTSSPTVRNKFKG